MPARVIRCEKCPTTFKTPFSQRKYCQTCQILRDYEVFPYKFGVEPAKCSQCASEFFPARPNWTICAQCRNLAEQPSRYEACARCAKHYPPAPGLEATCSGCVQDSSNARIAYVKVLYERRERLIREEKSANSGKNVTN